LYFKQVAEETVIKNSSAKAFDASMLNSRFIEDANMPDGTILAPQTQFIKVWKMSNNGRIPVSIYNIFIKLYSYIGTNIDIF
jgi:hypothetical protein